MRPIYLDSHATTPLDSRVLDAMMPWLTDRFGNAASTTHRFGEEAAEAVARSREIVARTVGAEPDEVVFTSGATESVNLALKGVAESRAHKGHIVTCATEHPAVLDTCAWLEEQGAAVTRLAVEPDGTLPPSRVAEAVREDTMLVSIMHANNEIGVVHDLAAIGAVCAERQVPLHTDATQSAGKIPVRMDAWNVRMLSLSAHKFYGPKGVGALIVRRGKPRVRVSPQMHGGGHEGGMRSGTLNVAGIVGMACALEICGDEMDAEAARLAGLRDRLRNRLLGELDELEENGAAANKLAHNLNVAFRYVDSVALLNEIPEIAVSTGSACSSADPKPSHVLLALGKAEDHARSSVRFGLHRFTTTEDIDRTAELVIAAVKRLRGHSGLYQEKGV